MQNIYLVTLIKDGFISSKPWKVTIKYSAGSGKGVSEFFRTKTNARRYVDNFTEEVAAGPDRVELM